MNWKDVSELLRPAEKKVALFVILFVLFVPVVAHDNGIRCITAPCPATSYSSILFYLLSTSGAIYEYLYIPAMIGAVATYLIACLLASLYRSVKK